MPSTEVVPFIGGFLFFLIYYGILCFVTRRSPATQSAIVKTTRTREMFLFYGNLAIVAAGTAISVTALTHTAGGQPMNPTEFERLLVSAQTLIHVVWVIGGVAAGALLVFLIQFGKAVIDESKSKSQDKGEKQEVEINISTKKLESIIKEIEGYRKAKGDLDDFFNKVQELLNTETKKDQ